MPIKSIARSHSADPAQEKLRQRKDDWNSECKIYIAKLNATKPHLIAFKRALNGVGDIKAGLPTSNIKDPLPSEIVSYLGFVSSEFQELVSIFSNLMSGANAIVQEQASYSMNRHKPMPKNKISELETSSIIVEASNPVTRYWAHLSSILSSDEKTQRRLSMLAATHELFKLIDDFEDIVLDRDIDNVPKLMEFYIKIKNKLEFLKNASKSLFEQNLSKIVNHINEDEANIKSPITIEDAKTEFPNIQSKFRLDDSLLSRVTPVNDKTTPEQLRANIVVMMNSGVGFTSLEAKPFLNLFLNRSSEKDANKKQLMSDRLFELYKDMLNIFRKIISEKTQTKLPANSSLEEILSFIKNASKINDSLNKYSSHYLSKLFKEYADRFKKQDATSASRMDLFKELKTAKKSADYLMDLLESKHVSHTDFIQAINDIAASVKIMLPPLELLVVTYENKHFSDKTNTRNTDPTKRYFNRRIRRDIDNLGR